EEARQPTFAAGALNGALAGIGDLRIGNAGRCHAVVRVDVSEPHDAGELYPFLSLAQLHDLFPPDERRTVGAHFGDGYGEIADQPARLGSVSLTTERRRAGRIKDRWVE